MLFEKDGLKVRHLQLEDKYLMAKWLSTPAVLEFYEGRDSPFTLEMVTEKFFKTEKDIERCLVEYNDEKIGYIQFYPVNDNTSKIDDYGDILLSTKGVVTKFFTFEHFFFMSAILWNSLNNF